jgi:hypothetical protein
MNALTTINQALEQVQVEEKLFELAQRKAKVYSESSLVPKEYQRNVGNVLIATDMARRMGADVLMVMQNLYIVHGRPGWSAQFLIATFNSCGRFSAIRYRFKGKPGSDDWGCLAYCVESATNEELTGTEITIGIAKKEGWYGKPGSKWQTIPEQMLRYRAATFLIKSIAPEIGMGLQTAEELQDMGPGQVIEPIKVQPSNGGVAGLRDRLLPTPAAEPALESNSVELVVTQEPSPEPELTPAVAPSPEPATTGGLFGDQDTDWPAIFKAAPTLRAAGELAGSLTKEHPDRAQEIENAYAARIKEIRGR